MVRNWIQGVIVKNIGGIVKVGDRGVLRLQKLQIYENFQKAQSCQYFKDCMG